MKKNHLFFILSFSAILNWACVGDGGYDAERCEPEPVPVPQVTIVPQWINTDPTGDDVQIDVTSLARAVYHYTSGPDGAVVELDPGTYQLIGWEPAAEVSVDGELVTVYLDNTGRALDPGEFAAGIAEREVTDAATDQVLYLPMRRQTRQVIIRIQFTGQGTAYLQGATGELSGIALTRNINDGFPPADGTVRPAALNAGSIGYDFVQTTETLLTGTRRLIGIDGESVQNLDLEINLTGGLTRYVDLDVSSAHGRIPYRERGRAPLHQYLDQPGDRYVVDHRRLELRRRRMAGREHTE